MDKNNGSNDSMTISNLSSGITTITCDNLYNNWITTGFCSGGLDTTGEICTYDNYLSRNIRECLKNNEELRKQVIEDILEEGFVQEDYNIIINYIRTYLEKLMDSPEDITLRNEVDALKKEIAELKDKLFSITDGKA